MSFENYFVITTGIGFISGWVSHSLFNLIFRDEPNSQVNKDLLSKELKKDKKVLLGMIEKQTSTISSLCERLPYLKSNDVTPKEEYSAKDSPPPVQYQKPRMIGPNTELYPSPPKDEGNLNIPPVITASKTEEELANLFEEEDQRNSKSVQEKLEAGRKVGEEPVSYFTSKAGGYVTLSEVKDASDKSTKFKKEGRLKRADELDIIHTFNNIRGMNYYEALKLVENQGYSLHPIYVNRGKKIPRSTYSGTVLGVSIDDSFYNYYDNKPSNDGVIVCIVDVGGQDSEDRENPSKK